MPALSREQVAEHAMNVSPFYKELYQGIQQRSWQFENLPIATVEKVRDLVENGFTFHAPGDLHGICFSSSGTTGVAKASFFDMDEWKINNELIGKTHFASGAIRKGDAVVNLAYAGHASFMAVHGVVESFPASCSEIAIGADRDFIETIDLCERFNADVITGVYSAFLGLAAEMIKHGRSNRRVHSLLGGGENLYGGQAEMIRRAFPNAIVSPFIYGSTDAGLIGYSDIKNETSKFRIYDEASYVEIVDPQDHSIIDEPGRIGLLVVTNLLRRYAPVVRYCNGDLVTWMDSSSTNRRFEYLGRVYEPIEIEGVTLSSADVERLIRAVQGELSLVKIQLLLTESPSGPQMTLYYSELDGTSDSRRSETVITNRFFELLPSLADAASKRNNFFRVESVDFSFFASQVRKRGKLLVDERVSKS